MRKAFARFFAAAAKRLTPSRQHDPEDRALIRLQAGLLNDAAEREARYRQDYVERAAELVEARQMAGAGPWLVAEAREAVAEGRKLRETNPITSQGAFGDIELALQNVEWRREVNLSWLEFSRWGIQQIMLIARLYYIKNPLIRRLIDIAAYYVFGRGVEVSSDDEDANVVLEEFFERNKKTLGQIALVELEKRKYYDGNLFFVFFPDTNDKGEVNVRSIDATEIQDIITDPNDSDTPWYYRRQWQQRNVNEANGTVSFATMQRWYPALGYDPEVKPKAIGGESSPVEISWDTPVLHRKCGGVAKWHFGCPIIYPAIDWAKASKKFLENCATVKAALAQIAMKFTTKGGQQALEGMKQQLQTTVAADGALWDQNPTATTGGVFGSGPGTTLEAFNTKGGGGDPEEVRQFKLMCCIVVGVPETFLGDVNTGNLATAASLDRPTELCFMEKQEAWREDLVTMGMYVLSVSKGAPSGKLREAMERRKMSAGDIDNLRLMECERKRDRLGRLKYVVAEADAKADKTAIKVRATFPAIREGDLKDLVTGMVDSMTLGNKDGQVLGIDEKEGVRRLYEINGFENADELVERQYPEGEYDPDRTKEPPEPAAAAVPAVVPGADPEVKPTEAQRRLASRLVAEALHE